MKIRRIVLKRGTVSRRLAIVHYNQWNHPNDPLYCNHAFVAIRDFFNDLNSLCRSAP